MISKKRKNMLKKISLLLVTIVIFFAFPEISCRLLYDESENYEKRVWETLQDFRYSDYFSEGKYIKPENGLSYRVNDNMLDKERYFPFNDYNTSKIADSGVYRIAVLGDSFTSCGGLNNKECETMSYTKQLGRLLNNEANNVKGIDKFEILVFTRGGINTYQELVLLKELGMLYNPDMIILQYCDNDIGLTRTELGFNENGLHILSGTRFLELGDRIVPAFPFIDERVSWFLLKNSAFMRFLSYKTNIILSDKMYDVESSFDSIREMDKIADDNDISFIVINFPPAAPQEDNCGDPKNNAQGLAAGIDLHGELEKITNDLDVPFYNMCNHVDDIHSILTNIEGDDCHYNVEGYSIAAEVLKDAVLETFETQNSNE
ncbi:MAG: hypothetical protein KAS04_03690 [Candidatus Aenigmarchaeota archaeon]|nr:hypothetical protein [Candidatus Aenigmarchaeota archaeon]